MAEIVTKAIRSAIIFAAGIFAIWAFMPEARAIAAGLLLGIAASIVNAFLLWRRMDWIGQTSAAGMAKRRTGTGMASRLAVVLLAAMTALRFPEHFNMPATLLACFYVQLLVFVTAIWHHVRHFKGKG